MHYLALYTLSLEAIKPMLKHTTIQHCTYQQGFRFLISKPIYMNMPENLEIATIPLTEDQRIQNLVEDLTAYVSESHIDREVMVDALVDAKSIEIEEARWD